MKYTTYVIVNSKGIRYKGYTSHLEQRLQQHNEGKSLWTKNKGPWKLFFTREFNSRTEAIKYEKFLKSGKGREFLNTLSGFSSVG